MKIFLYFSGLILLFSSCIKNNPDPAWIEVSEWQLEENPNSQYPTGVLTEDISQAWIYVNNDLIGVFEVPFKIPVLAEGDAEILIFPAIKNNGISATKKIYPFLEPYQLNAPLVKNEILSIDPTTRYYENVQFWVEDFEEASFDIIDGNGSLASIERVSDPSVLDPDVNENSFGRVTLTSSEDFWLGTTIANNGGTVFMDLPVGQEVYMEIDYHLTTSLTTGVVSIGSSGVIDNPNVRINAQDPSTVEWKKIYIDVRDIVSGSPISDYFEFSFQAFLDGSITREINIDNIKAVYF